MDTHITEMKKLLTEFKDENINLWELNDEIYYNSINEQSNNQILFDLIKDDESDTSLLITLLLWVNPNSILQDEKNDLNSFTHFLNSLRNKNSDFFNQDIKWYLTDNEHFVFVKDNLLFIINNTNYDIISQLPTEFSNTTLCCENCNEEMSVTCVIEVPSKTFYIFSIA